MSDHETSKPGGPSEAEPTPGVSRRAMLGGLSGLALAAGLPARGTKPADAAAGDPRLARAYAVRTQAAAKLLGRGPTQHRANGDEELYPDRAACFTKGLPHDEAGRVNPDSYRMYLRAIETGEQEAFHLLHLDAAARLANPQAAWAYDLIGPDASQPTVPAAPRLDSAEQAAEMVELYWQAELRDVPFSAYGRHPLAQAAASELGGLSGFRGPRRDGVVTADTLFRGPFAGDLVGPYVSQFLWHPMPWASIVVRPKTKTTAPGLDYLADYGDWLATQCGGMNGSNNFDGEDRYIRTGRDLGEYVHRDISFQPFLGACLVGFRLGCVVDKANPYFLSRSETAFITHGAPFLFYLLGVVTQAALKACWYQKWRVHRRLRPEELGGRLEAHRRGLAELAVHADLTSSRSLARVVERTGTSLLTQAYPEGCPLHPAYPSGHAVIGGACATAVKTFLDESYPIPNPVVASEDGLSLEPYRGPELTVGGELDKLASNLAFGRNFAGIHWRSDGAEGLRLGEEVAIAVMEELATTTPEAFAGYRLRRFDGREVTIG
ncbi:MAG TPA: vanadium-dependent haloperoxidase [Thermoanaerobaculia bacterium]|nr:vanadium-dependent haloperoxidase [Thermoanaerobaculia bacterium]